MTKVTPLGAVGRGLAAGAVGAWAIGRFFKLTGTLAPAPPQDFEPPDEIQKKEEPTHTVARRGVEGFLRAGPLDDATKAKLGQAVHFGFGAGWGALYGLVRETLPSLGPVAGILGFGTAVWAIADGAILPAFKLSPPAHHVPWKFAGYLWAAHIAYAMAAWAAYEGFRPQSISQVAAELWAFRTNRAIKSALPALARPAVRRVLRRAAHLAAEL